MIELLYGYLGVTNFTHKPDYKNRQMRAAQGKPVFPVQLSNDVNGCQSQAMHACNSQQHPILNDILFELEELSKEKTIEFITNFVEGDKQTAQLTSKTSTLSGNLAFSYDSGQQSMSLYYIPIQFDHANISKCSGSLDFLNATAQQSIHLKNICTLPENKNSSKELAR
ncbi:12745_t:CDS:2, partial [Dentiscutata erythropus]